MRIHYRMFRRGKPYFIMEVTYSMLKTCPECKHLVSDKAYTCPNCGYPINKPKTSKSKRRTSKPRLPNGFGQITKISGRKLRNPYRVMVTVGKDDEGRPIAKLLKPVAYFPTYNAAYEALTEYNKDPYNISQTITINEMFNDWIADHKVDNPRSLKNIKHAWAYCEPIYNIEAQSIRSRHIRMLLNAPYKMVDGEKVFASPATQKKIKSTLNQLCDWGVKYELMTKNYAREVNTDIEENRTHHKSFRKDEMEALWKIEVDEFYAKMVLFQCYTGWRPSEMVSIRKENINFDEMTITGGMKTASGRNRIVPIHSKIQSIFNYFVEISSDSEWLFPSRYKRECSIGYSAYNKYFKVLIKKYNLDQDHTPHDCRKQFVTMAKEAGVDEYALKRLVGHSIGDLTEETYTDRSVEWLRTEIEKIK